MELFKFTMMTIFIGYVRSLHPKVFFFMIHTTQATQAKISIYNCQKESELKVNIVPIQQQQRGGANCGLLAVAVFLALASGDSPATVSKNACTLKQV